MQALAVPAAYLIAVIHLLAELDDSARMDVGWGPFLLIGAIVFSVVVMWVCAVASIFWSVWQARPQRS